MGEGSFGRVYRGSLRGSEVAIKRLLCENISPAALRALRKEVTILSQLRHPGLPALHRRVHAAAQRGD